MALKIFSVPWHHLCSEELNELPMQKNPADVFSFDCTDFVKNYLVKHLREFIYFSFFGRFLCSLLVWFIIVLYCKFPGGEGIT